MVVMPFAFLLHSSGILFFLLSVTDLVFLPSKLALKLMSSNSILTSNSLSAAQILNFLSFALYDSSFETSCSVFKQVFKMRKHMCVCMHSLLDFLLCLQTSLQYEEAHVCVHAFFIGIVSAPNPVPVYVHL